MNKKQTIVAWAIIFSIAIAIANTITTLPSIVFPSIVKFYLSFLIILIIGGILIYMLRNKKA